MAQAGQGSYFQLPGSFPGDADRRGRVGECDGLASAQAETEADDLRLRRGQVAAESGMALGEAELLLRASQPTFSLSTPVGEDDTELEDLLAGTEPDPERVVTDAVRSQEISQILGHLTPSEAKVISLRFGLGGGEPVTLADAAATIGISRERARQLEVRALGRLRHLPELAELAG